MTHSAQIVSCIWNWVAHMGITLPGCSAKTYLKRSYSGGRHSRALPLRPRCMSGTLMTAPPVRMPGHAEQQIRLSAAATADLQALAQQHQLSLNTLVQSAWAMLLSRYSGQEDVVFGATVAGRPTDLAGVESMIGLFINTLPVRVRVDPKALLIPWLQERQHQQVEARQYEYSPLVQVQGWSDVPRGLPLFESLLVFENYPVRTSMQEWSNSLEIHRVRVASRTNYPLTVVAVPGPELTLRIAYQCHRFDTATINRMLGHLRTLLEGMVTDPARRLVDLPMLTQAERHQLLGEWNDSSLAYPQDTVSTSCLKLKWHAPQMP